MELFVSRSAASRARRTQGPSMFRNECVIKNDLDVFEELWRWLERCLERACELKERLVDSREGRRRAGKGKVERGCRGASIMAKNGIARSARASFPGTRAKSETTRVSGPCVAGTSYLLIGRFRVRSTLAWQIRPQLGMASGTGNLGLFPGTFDEMTKSRVERSALLARPLYLGEGDFHLPPQTEAFALQFSSSSSSSTSPSRHLIISSSWALCSTSARSTAGLPTGIR